MRRTNLRQEIKAFENGKDSSIIAKEEQTIFSPAGFRDDHQWINSLEPTFVSRLDFSRNPLWVYHLNFSGLKYWVFYDGVLWISYTMNKLLSLWLELPKNDFIYYKFWPSFRPIANLFSLDPNPIQINYRSYQFLAERNLDVKNQSLSPSPYPRLDLLRSWITYEQYLCYAVDILFVEITEPNPPEIIKINLGISNGLKEEIICSTSTHPLLITTRQSRIYAVPLNGLIYTSEDVQDYVMDLWRWTESGRENGDICPATYVLSGTGIWLESPLPNGTFVYLFRIRTEDE